MYVYVHVHVNALCSVWMPFCLVNVPWFYKVDSVVYGFVWSLSYAECSVLFIWKTCDICSESMKCIDSLAQTPTAILYRRLQIFSFKFRIPYWIYWILIYFFSIMRYMYFENDIFSINYMCVKHGISSRCFIITTMWELLTEISF